LEALKLVQTVVPERKVNALGYCLGGTLLSIAAALVAQEDDKTLNSITLLAAQTDFTEAGELKLFIDDSQLNYLDDIMWEQGYLDTKHMSAVFQLLRSNDLIWSRLVKEYLLGQRAFMINTDLMAWNADTTRMPFRMHSEYLRRLFLNNDLFEGRYQTEGQTVVLSDIRAPIFAVSTETDHVAPWRSVYKINLINSMDITFLLTSGGHNAGIISEPVQKNQHYRVSHRAAGEAYIDPESWYVSNPSLEGSWWPVWAEWLEQKSTGRSAPPALGAADKGYPLLGAAPGRYIFEH
jgi:polyhydroxyalkanoate synthase